MVQYELNLPPHGNNIGLNLMDDDYFALPRIIGIIPNSPAGHQLPYKSNNNVCILGLSIFVSGYSNEDKNVALKVLDVAIFS